MKFAFPEFLFAFVVLLIPIIIHLFNFRKYKTLYFSSLQFLKSVEEQTKSTQKLKHILVLLARLLAFSCLILAFAQPYIPSVGTTKSTGNPILAIYLDNSFSMQAIGTNGELLSEGRETVRKIVTEASPGTSFLLFTNELNGIEQRITSKQEVLNRLDKINVSPIIKDLGTVLSLQKDVLEKENWNGPRQYISISDFQTVSNNLANVAIDSLGSYYPIQLKAQETKNLLIDSVWFTSPLRKVNNNNELHVRVKNYGETDLANVELNLDVDQYKRTVLVDVKANDSKETVINYTDKAAGIKSGFVEINDDQLYFDDKFFFSYAVKEGIDVLILNGEGSLPNPRYVYETDDYYNITELSENQLTLDAVQKSDLIVLNGLNTITSGQREKLTNFAAQGGSLFIIPGNNIEKTGYNNLLTTLNMPSLGNLKSSGLRVTDLNYEDAFFRGIFESKPNKLNLPLISKAYSFISNTRYNSTNLLSFQNKDGLLIKSSNANKVYILSTALNETHSKIINHALFAAILLRAGEYSQRNNDLYATIGETTQFKITDNNSKEGAIHLVNNSVDFIPPFTRKGNFNYLQLNDPSASENLAAGIYRIEKENKLGELAINYSRMESNTTSTSAEKIADVLKLKGASKVNASTITNLSEITTLELEKPTEFWRILLILALLFLLAEMLLLKFLKA